MDNKTGSQIDEERKIDRQTNRSADLKDNESQWASAATISALPLLSL